MDVTVVASWVSYMTFLCFHHIWLTKDWAVRQQYFIRNAQWWNEKPCKVKGNWYTKCRRRWLVGIGIYRGQVSSEQNRSVHQGKVVAVSTVSSRQKGKSGLWSIRQVLIVVHFFEMCLCVGSEVHIWIMRSKVSV